MSIINKFFSSFNKNQEIIDLALSEKIETTHILNDKPTIDKIIFTIEDISPKYTFDFTEEKFKKIFIHPQSKEWFVSIYEILPLYNINTPERVAAFLAQTCHESLDYTMLEENLYYTASGLRKTFPKYFKSVSAASSYAKNPQKIANLVYGNRMGNNNSGDGYKFRGRGPIQCTGKNNYTECSKFLFNDLTLVNDPDLILRDKKISIMSACWFWSVNDLNKYCDKMDIVGMTNKINGGTNGLADRKVRFTKYLTILQ